MAQVSATEIVSMSVGKIEISTTSSTTGWTDISGYGFTVTASGGARKTGEAYTHDGETALMTVGKVEPIELEFRGLYTEDTNAPFATIWTQFYDTGGGALYVQYSPKAGDTGDDLFTTDLCVITSCLPPSTDPSSGDPKPFAFTVRTGLITKSTIT